MPLVVVRVFPTWSVPVTLGRDVMSGALVAANTREVVAPSTTETTVSVTTRPAHLPLRERLRGAKGLCA